MKGMLMDKKRLCLSAAEVSEQTGISISLVRKLTRSGKIPHIRVGRRILYPAVALAEWLTQKPLAVLLLKGRCLMTKAANGEGTKCKLASGKWRSAFFVPLPDGSKKRIYRQFRTRKEADEWLSKIKSEISAGKPVLCSDQLFGEYLEQWYEKYGSVAIRDSTRMNYPDISVIFSVTRSRTSSLKT